MVILPEMSNTSCATMPASIPPLMTESLQRHASALAQVLRQRRKVLGVTVRNAAAAAGMSRDTWYRMERGELTVTIAAWFNALAVVGLRFGVGLDRPETEAAATDTIPLAIALADYPQLAALAWQMGEKTVLTPREAFDVYERNGRHLHGAALTPQEKALIDHLRQLFA
jgi:transcriptional regulator with XRE-family HTH domain